ncbi:MAG: thioredoxin-dependent thiol peroxidase [Candidatus Binataceae bacterium]|nr:thioredoxin-dependent thiol peroxidase [Candidatus Binataceae bacterium]
MANRENKKLTRAKDSKSDDQRRLTHPLEGAKAPAFELPDGSGRSISLDELLKASNLVLYFYPRDMTSGCTTQACSFSDRSNEIRKLGAQVIGISADSPSSHAKFAAKYDLKFPLLSDPENRVTNAYGVYKKKSLYGREFMGIERTTFIIDRSGLVRRVFTKVKVNGHIEEVLAALQDLRC